MDNEFQDLENTLKGLNPAAPDDACFERMMAALEGRLQGVAPDPVIERDLSKLRPAPPSRGVSERMLETVSRAAFPVDRNVVLFPGKPKPAASPRSRRPWFAAAAAVAVAGAFTALMVEGPETAPAGPVAGSENTVRETKGFVPASMGSGLQDATDEGVAWTRDGRPMRMVKVVFRDRVQYRDKDGKIIEVEQPRVEYLMVPENID